MHLDSAWQPVKDYVHKVMGVPEEEECFFDTWAEEKLSEILETQQKMSNFRRKKKLQRNSAEFVSCVMTSPIRQA